MIDRARTEAQNIVEQAQRDAASLVERRTRMAESKIAAAERTAIAEVRAKVANAATAAAARLIAEQHDASADRAMIDQTIAGPRPHALIPAGTSAVRPRAPLGPTDAQPMSATVGS
jgi:F-type H+-transporting ATPase subunit b